MKEHIVAKPVFAQGVVFVVFLKGVPVAFELFGAKHKHAFVAVFVVFYDRQCRKRFAEPHAVGKNAAVVAFKLVDDGKSCVFLEVVKLFPDNAFLKAERLVGQFVFGDVLQKFAENVVKRYKVDEFGRVFTIDRRNVFYDDVGYVLELCFVVPNGIECLNVSLVRGASNLWTKLKALLPRSQPISTVVKPFSGR